MKAILAFVRATLTGGVLIMLPVVLLIILFTKAHAILLKISGPIADKFPDIIFGFDGSNLVAIFLLIVICFLSGLLFRSVRVKKWVDRLEESVLIYIPGYALIKSITADTIGEVDDRNMKSVLIQDGEVWNMAFLVEEGETLSTVFVPDAPRHDAGEIRIVPKHMIRKLDISANKFAQSIKTYGKGVVQWVK